LSAKATTSITPIAARKETRPGGQEGPAEDFAKDDRHGRDRGDQNGLQKSLAAVFDHRDFRKDGAEEEDHDKRADEEVFQKIAAAGNAGAKAAAHAGAENDPEENRRGQCADDSGPLAQKTNQIAPA
jgi:hypothetical protein